MALHLIVGPSSTGKTGMLHQLIRADLKHGRSTLVVPTAPDARRASREFAAKGWLGVRVVVYDDLVEELWGLYGDGRRFVTEGARLVLLSRAVRSARSSLDTPGDSGGLQRLMAGVAARLVGPISPQGETAAAVGVILGAYVSLLEGEGLIEPTTAAMSLSANPPHLEGPLRVNRFTDFSPAQERLLVSLAECTDIAVALTWEEDSPATEAVGALVGRLQKAGAVIEAAGDSAYTDPGLEALAVHLFRGGAPLEQPESLTIGSAVGTEGECAAAAMLARQAIQRGQGTVVVTFRDVVSRIGPLLTAFTAEGVRVQVDLAVPFGSTPFGRAFLALLDACSHRGDTRERMMAFLLSPYSGVEADLVMRLDTEWRRERPSGNLIIRAVVRLGGGAARAVEEGCRLGATRFNRQGALKWKKVADCLLTAAFKMEHAGLHAPQDSAAHRSVLDVLSSLEQVESYDVSERDIVRALETSRVSIGEPGETGDVLVTEMERIRGRRFDTVIVGGLTAAEFPAQRPRGLGAVILESLGQPVGPENALVERALFHATLTRARSHLVLVSQSVDDRGDALRPSAFLEEVLAVYGQSSADRAATGPVFDANRWEQRSEATRFAPRIPPRGALFHEDVLADLGDEREYSVSEIETYVACPYRWYYDRVVRPESTDREFATREKGSLAHTIIAQFYARWGAAGARRVECGGIDHALEVLGEVAQEVVEEARRGARGLSERLATQDALLWARAVVRDDAEFLPGYVPVHHEWAFGDTAGRPIRLGGVRLKGSIDRVDIGTAGVVVTDYKSSASLSGAATFEKKGLIQVPLYLAAAMTALGTEPVGCLYRSLKDLSVRGAWRQDVVAPGRGWSRSDSTDAEGIRAVIAAAVSKVEEAVEGMRCGRIQPLPIAASACEYCGARNFCREGS